MKRKILLLLFAVVFTALSYAQSITRIIPISEALQYAKSYCNDSDGKYDYYKGRTTKTINGLQYYYIFVDQQPNAGWEHPCKHIYVNVKGVSVDTPIICEDDTRPLDNVSLKQLAVKKRYGSNSALKPKVTKINTNAGEKKNKFAGNTYAIILSGGMNKNANDERYWNDCSFIYQTLINRYAIPKENIKVIMSDGTDPGEDMTDFGGEYVSSPIDLDGDGVADIGYSATNKNVTNVIKETASSLKDEDHLFLFVVDHGGYDKQKKQSYICLWNGDRLYPDELNDCLNAGDAGYVSVLMGQCYSGGFVDALKANNRIVATACGENEMSYGCEELPFDEFVYHFTSALNGYDALGNKATVSDGKGHVTMAAAYSYARDNDMYTNGQFPYAEETPTLTMLSNSTAESLALDTIPNVVDLYITRGEIQTEDSLSLSTVTDKKPLYLEDSFLNKPFWDSSDIWVRHNPDGFENHINQSQTFPDTCNVAYVYVNVRNRGVKPYNSDDWMVKAYYARSSMKIGKKVWLGKSLAYKSNSYGKEMDVCFLDQPIQPGGNFIAEIEYPFNKTERSYIHKPDFNMCILAFLTPNVSSDDDMLTDDDYQIPAVWRTKKLAQKNLTTLFYETRVDDDVLDMEPTVMVPVDKVAKEYKIRVMPSSKTGNLFNDMRLTMNVPAGSVLAWTPQIYKNGAMYFPATPSLTSVALSDSCVINAVKLSSSTACAVNVKAETNASDNLDAQEYKFNLALYDADTDALLGGETYVIKRSPRKKIDFTVDSRLSSGKYELMATAASEEVSYRWYDAGGNLVGNGYRCEVPANSKSTTYTVEAVSVSDGAYCRKAVSVERKLLIDKVRPTDCGMIEVTFTAPVSKGMSLNLSSADGTSSVYGSLIPEGSRNIMLNGSNISHGTCQLTLVENGTPVESRKFIK